MIEQQETPAAHSLLLGAHMSIAGGFAAAVERAERIGCTAMQIFVKNNNRWQGKPIGDSDVSTYKDVLVKSRIRAVLAHDTYLVNLCATTPEVLLRSRSTLKDEMCRCELLGITSLNIHPGAHGGKGSVEGIARIAESLNVLFEQTRGDKVNILLETMAGQGTSIGRSFEELRSVVDQIEQKNRIGVCVDTCHIFAAGYDVRTESGWNSTFREFEDIIGLDRLAAFHVNDSKRELGSHVDRHEHIGKGQIGLNGFRHLMNDDRFKHTPKILETPKGEEMLEDLENMRILTSLVENGH